MPEAIPGTERSRKSPDRPLRFRVQRQPKRLRVLQLVRRRNPRESQRDGALQRRCLPGRVPGLYREIQGYVAGQVSEKKRGGFLGHAVHDSVLGQANLLHRDERTEGSYPELEQGLERESVCSYAQAVAGQLD